MVELVADDRVVGRQDRLEQAAVGVERAAVEDRVLGAEEAADRVLQLLVDRLRAADEADAGHAEAVVVKALVGGGGDGGVLGEAEVVVGAEDDDLLAVSAPPSSGLWTPPASCCGVDAAHAVAEAFGDADAGSLRRGDDALTPCRARRGGWRRAFAEGRL